MEKGIFMKSRFVLLALLVNTQLHAKSVDHLTPEQKQDFARVYGEPCDSCELPSVPTNAKPHLTDDQKRDFARIYGVPGIPDFSPQAPHRFYAPVETESSPASDPHMCMQSHACSFACPQNCAAQIVNVLTCQTGDTVTSLDLEISQVGSDYEFALYVRHKLAHELPGPYATGKLSRHGEIFESSAFKIFRNTYGYVFQSLNDNAEIEFSESHCIAH
jgi:hypothetical protein